MYCSSCGKQNNDGAKFCSSCGAPLNSQQGYQQNNQANYQQANQQYSQPYGSQNNYTQYRNPLIQSKDIVLCIIFSVITCGIYSLYWLYCLAEDINKIKNDPNATSGGMVVLLTIITCGIYGLYWTYKAGETLDCFMLSNGAGSRGIVYLIISLFGPTTIITYALIQNDLNTISRG